MKRLWLLLTLVCVACTLRAYAHLLPTQHATFRFDGDKLYMVLAMSPAALDAACDTEGSLSARAYGACQHRMVDYLADRLALFSASGPAQLLDLRLAPTLNHDDADAVDQITALGVFRLPSTLDPLYLVLDVYSEERGGDRYDIVVSDTTSDARRHLSLTRAAPILALRDEPFGEPQPLLEGAIAAQESLASGEEAPK